MSISVLTRKYLPSIFTAWLATGFIASPVSAQDGHHLQAQKPKASVERPSLAPLPPEKAVETDAERYCANVGPSIVEARVAWQVKRLGDLDAQVKQRIADLEKAEAEARDWIAKRDALIAAASDEVVAVYARMEPESAARQIGIMDDRMAAAILGRLKPTAAGAILDEMEAERASHLESIIAGGDGKKS